MNHAFPTRRSSELVRLDHAAGMQRGGTDGLDDGRGERPFVEARGAAVGEQTERFRERRVAQKRTLRRRRARRIEEIVAAVRVVFQPRSIRSEEHTAELQSLMRTSYAVFCLK